MRISDWSSDVCSSDLDDARRLEGPHRRRRRDLLRRGRLAGYGARSHLAMAIADPVPPRIRSVREPAPRPPDAGRPLPAGGPQTGRSEEHTSELQSLMRNSYAVFCLKKKTKTTKNNTTHT